MGWKRIAAIERYRFEGLPMDCHQSPKEDQEMSSPMFNSGHIAGRGSQFLRVLSISLTLAALASGVVYAQSAATPSGNEAHAVTPADKALMYQHIMRARSVAGADLMQDFYHRCFIEPLYADSIAKSINSTATVEPAQVFDNLYFVGQNAVSSWVLKTSQGLILIDTENNAQEAQQIVEAGMVKLGLDPKQLKYIVITHEHADHFGGSRYLQQKYPGAHVMASADAWKNMPTANRGAGLFPAHDMDITDGQKFTLGDTTLTFYITPGHTDGTISFIFRTSDHGVPHLIGFFGGMGSPKTESYRDKIVKSYERWLKIAAAAGVDAMVANHQGMDHAVEKIEFLRVRHATDPNPFVMGTDALQRYFEIQEECAKADLARNGEKIPN
jgi:metallo-beta-lactamase class B